MALKPDRKILDGVDISYFCNTVAERGCVAFFDTTTTGVGAAMDDANAVVVPTGTTVSGRVPAGLLLCDVVNYDLTRQHINWHKDEVQLGSKVSLLRHGYVTTNVISGTPAPGNAAHCCVYQSFVGVAQTYTNLFGLATTSSDLSTTSATKVGTFLSGKDADGYAKVEINIT